MSTAHVFRSGNSQACSCPKEFQFKGKEVEIFRRGKEVVLREKTKEKRVTTFYAAHLPKTVLTRIRKRRRQVAN